MRTKISLKFKTLAHKGQAKELEQEVHEGQMEDKCQGWTATPRGKTISKTQDCREFKFFPKEFTLGVLNATFVLVVVSTSLGLCLPLSPTFGGCVGCPGPLFPLVVFASFSMFVFATLVLHFLRY